MSSSVQPNPLADVIASHPDPQTGGQVISRALEAVRSHLGMKVAYVSEFVGDRSVFRHVDAPGAEALIKPGDSHSLDDVYCRKILDGRIPELMPDTAAVEEAACMPITAAVPIGSHMSVPIKLPDGRVYGMFCCLNFQADHSLNGRDLQMMKAFADLTAFEISRDLEAANLLEEKRRRIKGALEERQLTAVYQPIYCLESGGMSGAEALSRFSGVPTRSPDKWFKEAAEVDLSIELEIAARTALSALSGLPPDVYLSVNASPQTVLSGGLTALLADLPGDRIVLEITEHTSVTDYEKLSAALLPIRATGVRLAIDEAGAGYSSLRHILDLQPEIIKLDIALTRNIHLDPARRALASALIRFGWETHCEIVAEGVETEGELLSLKNLGVQKAQGYHLGRPMPLAELRLLLNRQEGAGLLVA
jgi:EAL domain-containing protein (putative c-di-GMP-specific phosphodiesterase class I)